jgi:hypothetical protein
MLLRGSAHAGSATWKDVHALASMATGRDEHGDRAGFLDLVLSAEELSQPPCATEASAS